MDSSPGRTRVDSPWYRRQYAFHLGSTWKWTYSSSSSRHSIINGGRITPSWPRWGSAGWLFYLPTRPKRRSPNFGEEDKQASRRETLQNLRETCDSYDTLRTAAAAAVPFHVGADGCRSDAISAQKVSLSVDHWPCFPLLCRCLFRPHLRPAIDCFLLTLLSPDYLSSNCLGNNRERGGDSILQILSTQGTKNTKRRKRTGRASSPNSLRLRCPH